MITLNSPIKAIPGIGFKYTKVLNNHNIDKVKDILYLFPKTNERLPVSMTIVNGAPINVEITRVSQLYGKKKRTLITVKDVEGNTVTAVFFFHSKIFYVGNKLCLLGDISNGAMTHPEWFLGHKDTLERIEYHIKDVPARVLQQAILQAIELIQDPHLGKFQNDLRLCHTALDLNSKEALEFAEALVYRYALHNASKKLQTQVTKFTQIDYNDLIKNFGFNLTNCQENALDEIINDLMSGQKMTRILYGDVGSGKTMVAAISLAFAYKNGFQAALLTPTSILAQQHYTFLQKVMPDANVILLTGKTKSKKVLDKIATENAIIVGTHALIQEKVQYKNLRLVIIDEQHRFGVLQRMKGATYHTLLMTATPIPRTFQLASTGIIPVSRIMTRPQGHRNIKCESMSIKKINDAIQIVQRALSEGDSIFWVCPFIQENIAGMNLDERARILRERLGCTVGILHSRLSSENKEKVLTQFYNKEIQVLVSTTVIEVGINVPHANTMVVENCELFGMAQLYQLMGRVGRGSKAGKCIFLYDKYTKDTGLRLHALFTCSSGLELAERDVYIRGFGELIGTRQSGESYFRIVDANNHELFEKAAQIIANNENNLEFTEYMRSLSTMFDYLDESWQGG